MKTLVAFLFSTSVLFCNAQNDSIIYPVAPHSDTRDTIWGDVIEDSYRILEANDSAATKMWLNNEKEITDNYFKQISKSTEKIEADMRSIAYTRYNIPFRSGPYYIQTSGRAIYYKDYLRNTPELLITASTVNNKIKGFTNFKISKDGKYCALMYSEDGSDWQHIRVFNINNMWLMKDDVSNVRYSSVNWFGNGFFYSRYDSVDAKNRYTDIEINQKVYYHTLGTRATKDSLIFEDPDYPYNLFSLYVSPDERFVIIKESFPDQGQSIIWFKDTQKSSVFKPLIREADPSNTNIISNIDDTLIAVTTGQGAYNGQVIEIDTKKPSLWGIVVPNQKEYAIKQVMFIDGKYFILYQHSFDESMAVLSRDGDLLKSMTMPYGSSNAMICFSPDQNSIIMAKQYYICPPIGQLLSLKDFSLTPIQKVTGTTFDITKYKFLTTNYRSKDGTLIPIYIVTHKDYAKMASPAALLEVYGGFGISPSAHFDPAILTFVNNGGMYAFANVRGGSNSINSWHESGTVLKKQNTIDDIYYAARFLIDSGLANPDKIGIIGGSNGGLVIAAAINQHPETFKAAVLNVGVYDMMRFENFTTGAYHKKEFGSIHDSIEYKNLLSYSPLHNIKSKTNYPSMLIVTSQYDDRVPPLHSYKFAAALQAKTKSKNPIILLVNKDGGHQQSYRAGLDYSFLFKELNMLHVRSDFYAPK
jgi:prolyl oligopeptidase